MSDGELQEQRQTGPAAPRTGHLEAPRWVQAFSEGRAGQKQLLGGKGANLAEMTRIGLPVPPGFTVTTEACIAYVRGGRRFPDGLTDELERELGRLEENLGRRFGDRRRPLLLSVRSGAAISMPGMMDTILNLGLNDDTVQGLAAETGDERFARDCYRRFMQMFGNVVLGMEHGKFEEVLETHKRRRQIEFDVDLDAPALEGIIADYRDLIRRETGREFPQDTREQLLESVRAVFNSWDNPRAQVYRRLNHIPDDLGTAVNVQTMVFGNMGPGSGTGVVFTRNPSTGENRLYGEYLVNAQGEDVVAGIRTPQPIQRLADDLPQPYEELVRACRLLEDHYHDMQDIEFTVQQGRLYLLQTRTGKRTAHAAIKIAHDLVSGERISREEALRRVESEQVVKLLHRTIDPDAQVDVLARGLPASPGAASGTVVFDADVAERMGNEGKRVILVRPETTPDDIHGIVPAEGVLTSRGGMTCHAAIVARGMGKPCIVGCDEIRIDLAGRRFVAGDQIINEGDTVSIDGGTGQVIRGEVKLVEPVLSDEFRDILAWADETRRLGVRANADTPEDAARAREFGATGIGLCRTEHMFMAQDRLPVVQRMIMAETVEERREALGRLLPLQEGDFREILRAMAGYPVTIRLLDPPLHEFLPNIEELLVDITRMRHDPTVESKTLADKEELLRQARGLEEFNPMLGHRGCRLGISFPEIYEMQARAVFQATCALMDEGVDARPEIMIPLVGHFRELERLRALVDRVRQEVEEENDKEINCPIGTMIEVPRACMTAGDIAGYAEFFSFGTNDLTQTTFGFSRDDAEGKFLPEYLQQKILEENPFAVLDEDGVGRLMRLAVADGRAARAGLKVGICGEHGGDPRSINFCHRLGLDYVSCSPYRVPVARLAAAQASLRETTVSGAH